MFITRTESVTCISNKNKALYQEFMRLSKTATSATQKAKTKHISNLKSQRYLVSHDWPPVVVSVRLYEELKQMHYQAPSRNSHHFGGNPSCTF
jgi:hypothetical protein